MWLYFSRPRRLVLASGNADPGLRVEDQAKTNAGAEAFIAAIGLHRHSARDRDPPLI
jgi:catalase